MRKFQPHGSTAYYMKSRNRPVLSHHRNHDEMTREMNDGEYTDGYEPTHSELIPKNPDAARSWMEAAAAFGITQCDTQTFLRAWWAFAWLNPGFHPDDYDQWPDLQHAKELTEEAIRRANSTEIDHDSEFYAAEATHNAVWLKMLGSPNAPLTT